MIRRNRQRFSRAYKRVAFAQRSCSIKNPTREKHREKNGPLDPVRPVRRHLDARHLRAGSAEPLVYSCLRWRLHARLGLWFPARGLAVRPGGSGLGAGRAAALGASQRRLKSVTGKNQGAPERNPNWRVCQLEAGPDGSKRKAAEGLVRERA